MTPTLTVSARAHTIFTLLVFANHRLNSDVKLNSQASLWFLSTPNFHTLAQAYLHSPFP